MQPILLDDYTANLEAEFFCPAQPFTIIYSHFFLQDKPIWQHGTPEVNSKSLRGNPPAQSQFGKSGILISVLLADFL